MTKPLHIVLDGSVFELPATGVAKAAIGLYQGCVSLMSGLRITLIHRAPLQTGIPAQWEVRQFGARASPLIWRRFVLPRAITELSPDFVHFPWNGNIPRLPRHIGTVMTLHDVLPLEIPRYFRHRAARWRYRYRRHRDVRRAKLIITDSAYSAAAIQRNFRPSRPPIIIPLATSLPPAKSVNEKAQPYFIYVGGYDMRKGLEWMLETYYRLREEGHLDAPLLLTGSPNYFNRNIRALIQHGVQRGWLEEKGYLSDQALADLIVGARALIYPSRLEGFGLPPLEAMALGCPVITTPCSSLPEVCGSAALYAHPDHPQELASAWLRLDRDESLRKEMKARGIQQAATFSWPVSAAAFLRAWEDVGK